MRAITAITVCAIAAFAASVTFDTPAEAKKVNVSKKAGKNFARNASKSVSRSVRWVGTGLATGAAVVTHNCDYYHRRYRETGDRTWRNKYNNCIR
jgi:hypothetical protein